MDGSSTLLHVFVSIILGILAFALMGALNTWWGRNRAELKQRDPLPLFQVVLRFLALTGGSIAVILSVRELLPYDIASVQGILKSDRLFPLLAVDRYEARLEVSGERVDAGAPLVTYVRKLGPAELAEALLERELLAEQLAEVQSRLAVGDPIDELQKLSQVENLRAARTQQQQERSRAMWEIESLNFKVEEQQARVSLARKEVDFARDAIKSGLVSKIEYDRREETLRMEQARLDELQSRLDFTVDSMVDFAPTASSEGLMRLDEVLQADLFSRELTAGDSVLAELERRLREVDRVVSGELQQPITVAAPWAGLIAYRNPSAVLAPRDLVGVLVQSDSLFLEVLVSSAVADTIAQGVRVRVSNAQLDEMDVTLEGEIRRVAVENPEQSLVEVRLQPRADLIRDLALGREVRLTASFVNQPPVFIYELLHFFADISSRDVALLFSALLLGLIAVYRRQEKPAGTAASSLSGGV
jgi:hypothetical protein